MKRWFLLALLCLLTCGGLTTANAQVLMGGHIDYEIWGSRIYVYIEDITNFSEERTGRLRWRMWASEDPWRPERKGYMLTFRPVGRLGPAADHDDLDFSRPWHRPPSGWYYVTFTLEERTFDENGAVLWVLRDAIEFDNRRYFSRWDDDDWPWPF
jgi:GT2 family glycosyltransferase